MPQPTILGVHGLGDHRDGTWIENWKAAIGDTWLGEPITTFADFSYDDLFEGLDLSTTDHIKAVGKLLGSGLQSWWRGDERALQPENQARAGLFNLGHYLHWYPGYVVAFAERDDFRAAVIAAFLAKLREVKPQIVLAHSLGSLITYAALHDESAQAADFKSILANLQYVTLGSQIANPFVVGWLSQGRVQMPPVRRWFHLYNREDNVFTAPVKLPGELMYQQVDTFFDIDGFADHDAGDYLRHDGAAGYAWPMMRDDLESRASRGSRSESRAMAKKTMAAAAAERRAPRRRALLVGLNEYANPSSNLFGCVNDVYLMSAVLQEQGFPAEQIRVVLNDRATAKGILDRMRWLFDGAEPHDELFFFYSGHGAQLPTYGDGDTVDRMDETLVPHDFNWSPETCITDDAIFSLYSTLPYDTRLTMIFDCCHSGGIHRDGGPRARGLTPPDDIRHRSLRWDAESQLWIPREFKPIQKDFVRDDEMNELYAGANGSVCKLGRGMLARRLDTKQYDKAKSATKGPVGPYLPVILEACAESELAFEYRHGVESYGAFTFSMADLIRRSGGVTFKALRKEIEKRLEKLGYDQHPALLGPTKILGQKASFVAAK